MMLGCGRWGAKVGVPPLYIGDLLLAVATGHFLATWAFVGRRTATGVARRGHPGLAVVAFVGWATARFVLSADHGLVSLRDFAPYGYALVAFLSASAYSRSTAADRNRTVRFVEVALVWHLLWVVGSQLIDSSIPPSDLDEGFRPFVVRGDDGGVLGITACLFLLRYLRHGGPLRLVIAIASLGSTLAMASRGALLATLIGVAITLWCYFLDAKEDVRPSRRITMTGAIPIALFILVFGLPSTTAGSKLLASIGAKRPESKVDIGGLGTEQARSDAWERVIAYTGETLAREAAGVGFGPHFMIDSGASVALVHSDELSVRSPHNYFISVYARLGLVGVILLGLIAVQMIAGIWRVRRYTRTDDLMLLAIVVPPIILVEAAVATTLEAPFGAIPFFWFLGILLTKPKAADAI
jgi:hypothetical protein